jgi:hypothetical protein
MWGGAAFQHLSPGAPFWLSAALAAALLFYAVRFARLAPEPDTP